MNTTSLQLPIKKTITEYINLRLSSGSRNYNQPITYSHCHQIDNVLIYHNHFQSCSLSNHRNEYRINQFNHLLEIMKTPSSFGIPLIKDAAIYLCYQSLFKIHQIFDDIIMEILNSDRKFLAEKGKYIKHNDLMIA